MVNRSKPYPSHRLPWIKSHQQPQSNRYRCPGRVYQILRLFGRLFRHFGPGRPYRVGLAIAWGLRELGKSWRCKRPRGLGGLLPIMANAMYIIMYICGRRDVVYLFSNPGCRMKGSKHVSRFLNDSNSCLKTVTQYHWHI